MTIEMMRFDEMMGIEDVHHDDVGTWDDEEASEWVEADLAAILDEFADRHLDGASTAHPGAIGRIPSLRMWRSVSPDVSLGRQVGFEAAELLATYPDIHPSDVVVLCDRHRDGLEAAKVIEACGYPVEHSFTADRDVRNDALARLSWDGSGVKGCRTDQFAGRLISSTPKVVVVGIGRKSSSRRRFHEALATLAPAPDGHPVFVAVVNSDRELADFASVFDEGAPEREARRNNVFTIEAASVEVVVTSNVAVDNVPVIDWSPPNPAGRIDTA